MNLHEASFGGIMWYYWMVFAIAVAPLALATIAFSICTLLAAIIQLAEMIAGWCMWCASRLIAAVSRGRVPRRQRTYPSTSATLEDIIPWA
jgi:hypothetical protein